MARLGLISIQQRLPEACDSWEAGTLINGQAGSIRCTTSSGLQVPHGVDGDVLSAIITLYYAADNPGDRLVRTTLRELMRVAQTKQLDGRHYQIFKGSLQRLNRSNFTLKSAWKRRGTTGRLDASFYILESVTGWRKEEPVIPGREEEDLVIGLSPHLAYSAATGYVLTTQPAVMRTLDSASARGQYRLFEALRADPDDPTHLREKLHLSVQEFGDYARLLGGAQEAYRVRRIIQPALQQLQACGYLKHYNIVGRGTDLHFVLEFAADTSITDQRSVTLLESLGVTAKVAQQLALAHSRAEVEAICWLAEQKASRARKDPRLKEVASVPGLIVTLLRSGDGPTAITQYREHQRKSQAAVKPKVLADPCEPVQEVPAQVPDSKTLRFLLKGTSLAEDLMQRLERLFLSGKVSSVQIALLKKGTADQMSAQIEVWEQA